RVPVPRGRTELSWLAADDLLPAVAAAAYSAGPAVGIVGRRLRRKQAVDDGVGVGVEDLPLD
ncbi:MAG: hypothetical protein QOE93_1687, partial [Actinomycetota bacterium]|nr:hypothetical protein [Actinomycetota bacterium]